MAGAYGAPVYITHVASARMMATYHSFKRKRSSCGSGPSVQTTWGAHNAADSMHAAADTHVSQLFVGESVIIHPYQETY